MNKAFADYIKNNFHTSPMDVLTYWEIWQAAQAQAQAVSQQLLEADLGEAVTLLADWAVAVRDGGASWDNWDGYYKEVLYGKNRLRVRLNAAIEAAQEVRE